MNSCWKLHPRRRRWGDSSEWRGGDNERRRRWNDPYERHGDRYRDHHRGGGRGGYQHQPWHEGGREGGYRDRGHYDRYDGGGGGAGETINGGEERKKENKGLHCARVFRIEFSHSSLGGVTAMGLPVSFAGMTTYWMTKI